jgi:hypothetical protein
MERSKYSESKMMPGSNSYVVGNSPKTEDHILKLRREFTEAKGKEYEYRSYQREKSVRTYKEQEIPEQTLDKVKNYLQNDKGLFDVPITFTILDAKNDHVSSPVIIGADTYIAGKYRQQKNAEISFGYTFEKFVLYVISLGLGTVWLAATIDRKAFEKAVHLKEDEVMPAVTPLGFASEKRSIRESMM